MKFINELLTHDGERYVPHSDTFEELDPPHTSNYIFTINHLMHTHVDTVLDAGCGCGYGCAYLSRYIAKVVGVDQSKHAIQFAKNHFKNKKTNFRMANVTQLPFNQNSFDAAVSFDVIEHVQDYELFISELARVLEPNGILIISTPNKNTTSPNRSTPVCSFHAKEFYPCEFVQLLKNHFNSVIIFGKYMTSRNPSHDTKLKQYIGKIIVAVRRNFFGALCLALIPRSVKMWTRYKTYPPHKLSEIRVVRDNVVAADTIIIVARGAKI